MHMAQCNNDVLIGCPSCAYAARVSQAKTGGVTFRRSFQSHMRSTECGENFLVEFKLIQAEFPFLQNNLWAKRKWIKANELRIIKVEENFSYIAELFIVFLSDLFFFRRSSWDISEDLFLCQVETWVESIYWNHFFLKSIGKVTWREASTSDLTDYVGKQSLRLPKASTRTSSSTPVAKYSTGISPLSPSQ